MREINGFDMTSNNNGFAGCTFETELGEAPVISRHESGTGLVLKKGAEDTAESVLVPVPDDVCAIILGMDTFPLISVAEGDGEVLAVVHAKVKTA